ncbi:hypothetical protein CH247_15395 [Rhodococcus sp. 06-156-3b]|nr:hypothetical protein CH247_15395 [Rhodococcus sp. 06-156-3b]OZF65055.1 hypothetical protein CH290_10720 [Rhodococcus sp. 06-156-4]
MVASARARSRRRWPRTESKASRIAVARPGWGCPASRWAIAVEDATLMFANDHDLTAAPLGLAPPWTPVTLAEFLGDNPAGDRQTVTGAAGIGA